MPNLVVPLEAMVNWLQAQADDIPTLSDCWIRLISNEMIIDLETTLTELLDKQAMFPGSSPQQLADWTEAVIIDGKANTEAATLTFESEVESAEMLYGCFATNGAGDKLWFASLFDDPVPIPFETELQIDIELDLTSIFTS